MPKRNHGRERCAPYVFEGRELERTDGIVHHQRAECQGRGCPFHRPSTHIMVDWPMILRGSGLIERQCPHGIGHPDPDSVDFYRDLGRDDMGVHGCDGCCRSPLSVLGSMVDRISSTAAELAES